MPNIPFEIARDFKKKGADARSPAAERRGVGILLRFVRVVLVAAGGVALSWAILNGVGLI